METRITPGTCMTAGSREQAHDCLFNVRRRARIAAGLVAVLVLGGGLHLLAQAGSQDQTPYDATRLIWRWRGIMNTTLEDSRTFASEPVIDAMEEFVSPGAVRAIREKLTGDDLKKADAIVERYALEVVAASARQSDGSRVADGAALAAAEKAVCPVYPFCE